MVQIIEIQSLLELYVEIINNITRQFLIKFGKVNPSKLWRQGSIERTGVLDNGKTKFSFHGSGCTIEYEDGVIVSFDFLENDTFTFDLFKFENFVLSKLPNEDVSISEIFQKIKLYSDCGQWKIIGRDNVKN
jgi:hypothetical protein